MAVTYVTISKTNYINFGIAAIVTGILGFVGIIRFEYARSLNVVLIPEVGPDGKQLQDDRGKGVERTLIIGSESELRPEVKKELAEERAAKGGVSLRQFMSGYKDTPNDPDALWDPIVLTRIKTNLMVSLVIVVLLGVLTLFWAAFTVQIYTA